MNFYLLLSYLQQVTPSDTLNADTLGAVGLQEEKMSLLEMLAQGGILMIPLGILSLLAIYVIAERWYFLREAHIDSDDFFREIEKLLKNGKQDEALSFCDSIEKPLPRILKSGIQRLGRSIKNIEDGIQNAGKKEIFELEKRMNWLATIAGVAPLVGFTGTVTGMIEAFQDIQSLQGNVNPSVLAGGIWEALITTATGLIVGILALGFYNYLQGKINRMIHQLENASADFIELLQSPSSKKKRG